MEDQTEDALRGSEEPLELNAEGINPDGSIKAVSAKRRGRGRPTKDKVKSLTKGNRGKVGRPKGDAAIINEYKARMLASPKSAAVLNKVFEAALDDEHKNQAACMKMVMDRMLPLGYFEKDKMQKGSGGVEININLSGGPEEKEVAGVVIEGSVDE